MSESLERSYPEVWRLRRRRRQLAGHLIYAGLVLLISGLIAGAIGAADAAWVAWTRAAGVLAFPVLLAAFALRVFAGPYRCPRCGQVFSRPPKKESSSWPLFALRWPTQRCLNCGLPLTSEGPR